MSFWAATVNQREIALGNGVSPSASQTITSISASTRTLIMPTIPIRIESGGGQIRL